MAESYKTVDLLLDSKIDGSLSSQILYKFFCNNLRLGQWELARACIKILVGTNDKCGEQLEEILKDIIEEPLTYCDGSPSVQTPFHLSWLCLLEFFRHYEGKNDLPEIIQKKIEFRLLLQSCDSENISLQYLQELDSYHSKIIVTNRLAQKAPNISTSSWLKPLKNVIYKQPQIAHAIIQQLLGSGAEFASNNAFFQQLYLDIIKEYLTRLGALEESMKRNTELNNADESEQYIFKQHQLCCEAIHQLLIVWNPPLDTMELEVDELLMNLLHRVKNNPSEHLSKGSVYSALLIHSSDNLLQKFCSIENDWQLGLCSGSSLEQTSSLAGSFIPSEALLTRSFEKDRPNAWKLFYFHARNNHHILEEVVKSCVEFVRQGDFDKVTEILSCVEFSPMKVLVLLIAWPFCHSCDSAQKLLDILWDPNNPSRQLLLDQACTKLEYQVHLVKWCLDKAKPLIATSECPGEDHQKAYEIFQSLHSHSVLYVLHQSTNLSQLPELEVLEMLRTRPVFSSTPCATQHEKSSGDSGNSASAFDESAETQRDVALYHGFCALRSFMEAIMCSHNDSEGNIVSDVTKKIQEAQDHMNSIFLVTFRVEVLENVFSLMFVSAGDLSEEMSPTAVESDGLETPESRSLRSSRTTSMESFVSIDGKNISPWKIRNEMKPGHDSSPSRTTSPESLRKVDVENFAENQATTADHGLPKGFSKEYRVQQDVTNNDAVLGNIKPRLAPRTKPSRVRELQFDDVIVQSKEDEEVNEVLQLPLYDVQKDRKFFELSERKVKGLLVSKSLVGLLLEVLKKGLKDILSLIADQSEQGRCKVHADWIKTSISMTNLEQRVSRLGQYINEAQWRYQLVLSCCDGNKPNDEFTEEQASFTSDDDDSEAEEELGAGAAKSAPDLPNARKRSERMLDQPLTNTSLQDTSIPRLLSSPSSLIYMCMKKDNYGQAKHIIKLFDTDNNECSKLVLFAEEYEKSFQRLTQFQKSKTKEMSEKTSAKKGRLSILKNVASAAAAGIASVSPASIVEELLLSSSIDLTSSGLVVTEPAHAHFVHALVCFDFLCTGPMTKQSCRSLLGMAKRKMDLGMEIEPSTPYTLRRIAEFLTNLESLISDDENTLTAVGSFFGGVKPLNVNAVKNNAELQAQQDTTFVKLEEAIEDGDTDIKSITENPSTELPAVLKFKKMEYKTAVRVAMVEFQNAFDCEKDNRLIVLRKRRWLSQHRLDYVQSLYNHVNMLSTWELYWKMNPKERSDIQVGTKKPVTLKATNPFVVLTQGFDILAGKPLFERNVPPRSMESMCKKMNVNLIRIIVHNCCPVIPAFGPPEMDGPSLSSSTKVVLNGPISDEMTDIGDPVLFTQMLLTKMKEFLEGMKDPGTGIVDLQSLVVLSSSPSYFILLKEINKLSLLDLDMLASDEDKICFFANILNILLTHSVVTEVSDCFNHYSQSRDHISQGDNPEDHSSASWQHHLPSMDMPYCRTAFLKKYGYNIGQFGFISAFDLWFMVLRVGLQPPTTVQNVSLRSQVGHRYQKYLPRKSDYRINFVICDGTISAPEIQILNKDGLQGQLDDAMSNYLSSSVRINIEDEKILFPELLLWYQTDFTSDIRTSPSSKSDDRGFSGDENYIDLLLRLSPYLKGEQFMNIDDLAPQMNVSFTPHCCRFGYVFLNPSEIQRRQFITFESEAASEETETKYTLTKSLSSYLMARSPLVASLANLCCAQDSGENSDGEIPALFTNLSNPGTHSLEIASPFEFAIKKTSKFPVLQRHITSCFYSVLKFLYLGGLSLIQTSSPQSTISGTHLLVRNQSRLFLLDESSPEVSDLFLRAVNYAWCKGDWVLLLEILNSANLKEHGEICDPRDFVLEMAFESGVISKQEDDIAAQASSTLKAFQIPSPNLNLNWKQKPWLLLLRMKDDDLRAGIVLQCLHNLSEVNDCLELLKFCCSKPPNDPDLLEILQRKTKQIELCEKIMKCYSVRSLGGSRLANKNWKDVVEQSIKAPESVVDILLKQEEFDLVREWMEIYAYSSDLRQKIHEVYLRHLFKKTPVDITEVYMYLEEIKDPSEMLIICESMVAKPMAIPNVLFIINFIATDLDAVLKPHRKHELLRQKLGAMALLCIPESNRRSYESLVSQPLLLLEQLLMDMKVEWAAKAFSQLQNELKTNHNYSESLRKEVSSDLFENLLVIYASKALEFEVVSYKQSDNSHSSTTIRKESGTSDFRNIKSSTPVKKHQRHSSIGILQSTSRSSETNLETSTDKFKIPEQVPSEEKWEPDFDHSVCMICKDVTFNMFVRRHHCRRCGRVVCDNCSPFKHILEPYGRTPVRVCKDCDKMIYEESSEHKSNDPNLQTVSLPAYLHSKNMKEYTGFRNESFGSTFVKSEDEFNFDEHHGWKLTLDEKYNANIRDEYLYEQAPSSSLCTSILALHSDNKTCAKLLLELCNKLSQKLGFSEEVDNNLLISIICQLLLHAKLKFAKCGETQDVELCDTYMSRVELVKFLIESNYYDVPSIEDLMLSHTARRLRDRLIENESLSLAMEVTTKCGLDPGAVWGAWGLAYLQVGKFKEARQKFSKFLKPAERGKATQGNIRYLKIILDILETSPMISFDYLTVGDLDASLASLRERAKNSGGTVNLDSKRYEECIFYLNTYGSYPGVVSFYVNHNNLTLACRFILEKRCSPDIFTESLLMPTIRSGEFRHLPEILRKFDPTLEVWIPYLSGACRYLSRSNYLNVLYQVQLLMKDYFRAAMTCIMFYQGLPRRAASSYDQLYSRLNFLQDAKVHVDAVRKHQQSKKGTLAMVTNAVQLNMGETPEDKTRMNVTPTELTNYVNAISLQIEVTKFMHNCYIEGTLRKPKDDRENLGTLFDNANVKCDVVSQVLLAGSSVDDGFTLCYRIIQDFRLPATVIYKTVAQKLASRQKFNEILILLNNAIQTRLINDRDHDAVIVGVLGTITGDEKKWKQAETLIKLLKDEGKKIAAYIRYGRLRTAYLIAVAGERVEDVENIAKVAKQSEQTKVYDICVKWLANNAEKRRTRDVFPTAD